jgi:hypothetical protein
MGDLYPRCMGTDPRLNTPRTHRPYRPYARGPQRPQAPAPTRSAELVSEVLGRLGGTGRALEFRVFDCYSRVIGEALRTRTLPERLAGTTLFVRATTSVIAHELTHLIQFRLWVPTDTWMLESTAEWAGLAANGYKPSSGSLVQTQPAPLLLRPRPGIRHCREG